MTDRLGELALLADQREICPHRSASGNRKPGPGAGLVGKQGWRSLRGDEPRNHRAFEHRLNTTEVKTTEWKSRALRAYQRRTLVADALIAGCYRAVTDTRRVCRALAGLFAAKVEGHGEPGSATTHSSAIGARRGLVETIVLSSNFCKPKGITTG
jgi:hypothetical protein